MHIENSHHCSIIELSLRRHELNCQTKKLIKTYTKNKSIHCREEELSQHSTFVSRTIYIYIYIHMSLKNIEQQFKTLSN